LDDDVNQYLDRFKIEDTYHEPVTFAHLLTHTGGFDERELGMHAKSASEIVPLGEYLAAAMPPRVRPPGQVTQYSNHGMALAGYLVEVVSGVPYADYIERNIFQPLGMDRSTFRYPIPSYMASDLAVGYVALPSGKHWPAPVHYSNVVPAGPLYATATDVASFMIAHLQDGRYEDGRILQADTAREMHRQHFTNHERLPGMAYGFMEHLENKRRALWHTGSCNAFHSLIYLMPDEGVGLFMSANVLDRRISHDLIEMFMDRFYPPVGESSVLQPPRDLRDGAVRFTGAYRVNKHARLTPEKLSQLGRDARVTADGNGTLAVHLAGQTTKWTEIQPSVFRRVDGEEYLAFEEDTRHRIVLMFLGSVPYAAYEKLSWYETSLVHLTLLGFSVLSFLSAIIVGLISSVSQYVRCRPPVQLEWLARLARWVAVLVSILHLVFLVLRVVGVQADQGSSSSWNALFVLPLLAAVLTIALVGFTMLVWKERYWGVLGRVHYSLITLGALAFPPFLSYWNLLGVRF
jgi:CubicO group peptidase (beta-lactamase class C family)